MIRQFNLINSLGERKQLNDLNSFAYNPTGLGLSMSNEYYGANANFVGIGIGADQTSIKFNVLFGANGGNAYQDYSNFIKYLDLTPLQIEYQTDAGVFLKDVNFKELTKSEINEWNVIDEEITFESLTPWYREMSGNSVIYSDQDGDGKIYINNSSENNTGFYAYDYVYEEPAASTDNKYFHIKNESVYLGASTGSPLTVIIHGPVTNPAWELHVNSELLFSDRYFIDIPAGDTLVVSSVPQNERVELIGIDGTVSNVYSAQDYTKSNFVNIPKGESTLIFDVGSAKVEYTYREERLVV
ncbi:phage baseplate protein [Weissella diestrammenae]|uniref:Phage baseplate protein n=1 Tax=Weissella diestrammenae TaxID=1162633 RepID=A0A7G9T4R1_9LACO|nr:phage distal tail protein domain-containing protein [Weissella diestrammenae]MCM0582797.1 phage baseplate protein [Weissella diestrammenae]QNN75086.1 phage baseplate protein [Weissella diestrammenae]